jgi:hypothetical protein
VRGGTRDAAASQHSAPLQLLQLLLWIRRRIHFRVRLRDLPVLVDDVRNAARVLVLRGVGRAVREPDLALGIAQERERESVFLGEALVGELVVETRAVDQRVLGPVLVMEVPEPGTFTRSTRCVCLRIEPQHDLVAAKVAEADAVAVMIENVEVGSGITRFEHLWLPPC